MTDDKALIGEMIGFARHLGNAASAVSLPFFRAPLTVDDKGSDIFDPVTEADREAERAIRTLITERYPHHGIVGEELGAANADAEFTWVIDPIDGTRAFVAGMPTWTTLIGLLRNSQPYMGFVQQPFVGERFFGSAEGAYVENAQGTRRLAVSAVKDIGSAIMATTSPEIFRTAEETDCLSRLRAATRTIRYGTDAYGYCLLAAGHIDLVVEAGLAPYDVVAVIPIIRSAGGIVTTWSGGDPRHGGNLVAAATPELHAAALEVINA